MQDYTLVIIDMQPEFAAAECVDTQDAIVCEIMRARSRCQKVLIVNYNDGGQHVESIQEALIGYEKLTYQVDKYDDDGSRQIMDMVDMFDLARRFRICGVNYDACVQATVAGYESKWMNEGSGTRGMINNPFNVPPSDITIVEDACNAPDDGTWDKQTQWFRTRGIAVV